MAEGHAGMKGAQVALGANMQGTGRVSVEPPTSSRRMQANLVRAGGSVPRAGAARPAQGFGAPAPVTADDGMLSTCDNLHPIAQLPL